MKKKWLQKQGKTKLQQPPVRRQIAENTKALKSIEMSLVLFFFHYIKREQIENRNQIAFLEDIIINYEEVRSTPRETWLAVNTTATT